MKFVNPKTGEHYEVDTEKDSLGFASHLFDGGDEEDVKHLVRVEIYPLPCHHTLINEMVRRMNLAALTVLQEFGAGLDPDSAIVMGDSPLEGAPENSTKH